MANPEARWVVDAVLRAGQPAPDEVLAALARVPDLRAELDEVERQLISLARGHRLSWRAVATALGLRSRQAAEQRWLRLRAGQGRDPAGERQRTSRQRLVDSEAGDPVPELRAQVGLLRDRLARRSRQPDPPGPAARLAQRTLDTAVAASPGALYDLARLAVRDLRALPAQLLGWPVTEALARLVALVEAPQLRPGDSSSY